MRVTILTKSVVNNFNANQWVTSIHVLQRDSLLANSFRVSKASLKIPGFGDADPRINIKKPIADKLPTTTATLLMNADWQLKGAPVISGHIDSIYPFSWLWVLSL